MNRRTFLTAAAALGLVRIARGQIPIERGRFSEGDVPLAVDQLRKQLNTERTNAGLNALLLDDLACKVAAEHARDMIQGDFLSHWGRDGRKPYHRYSFAGGTEAVRENVSSAKNILSVTPTGVKKDLDDMHRSMLEEVPPNDGHRKTILFPQLTHVGFGIALQGHDLRLDEVYLARYIEVEPIPRTVKRKEKMKLRGKVLNPKYVLTGADLYFEPLPTPPAIEWLRQPRSVGLPETSRRLRPRLPDGYFYPDGSNGDIVMDGNGRFHTRVGLSKTPGINTIVFWLRTGDNGVPFPATEICIRVE
jgi:uncharacterized protein YkwD